MDLIQLKEYLESPKGQKLREKFAHELKIKEENKERRINGLTDFLINYDGDLDILLNRYHEHNIKCQERNAIIGLDKESLLASIILETFVNIGVLVESESNFSACKYEWNGYIAELFVGQGSFISVYKKDI